MAAFIHATSKPIYMHTCVHAPYSLLSPEYPTHRRPVEDRRVVGDTDTHLIRFYSRH